MRVSSTMTQIQFNSATDSLCSQKVSESKYISKLCICNFIFYWTQSYLFTLSNDVSSIFSKLSHSHRRQVNVLCEDEVFQRLRTGPLELQDKRLKQIKTKLIYIYLKHWIPLSPLLCLSLFFSLSIPFSPSSLIPSFSFLFSLSLFLNNAKRPSEKGISSDT